MSRWKKPDDPFGAKTDLETSQGQVVIYRLDRLEEIGFGKISRLPYSIRILLESLLRHMDNDLITEEDVKHVTQWQAKKNSRREIPFIPARVILQDFTGVPAIVDLASMRSEMKRLGGDPNKINPLIPLDMVIDHSIQVDCYGSPNAQIVNEKKEFERNSERYAFLRWAQGAFDNLRILPPGRGIVHQVNLEFLASVVQRKRIGDEFYAYPDSLIGTDSHTTMINGLGVLGWGVGGIEAEAVMLGQPYYMTIPEVVGVKLYGKLKEGVTATDLVLTLTELLRKHGVVGKFVEFFGPGATALSLQDRATISNMAPEYGATASYFPIDDQTVRYLKETGREKSLIELIKVYTQEQALFLNEEDPIPIYSEVLQLDLGSVEVSVAGPKRPQDRMPLGEVKKKFHEYMYNHIKGKVGEISQADRDYQSWVMNRASEKDIKNKQQENFGKNISEYEFNGEGAHLTHGSIVIAAITSCTNTSNPSVMLGAGLLAKNAVEKGLKVKPYIKTSLAPGSRVVINYLKDSGLLSYLEFLGFYLVGYGCLTCIGNSGPLSEEVTQVIEENDLVVAAVLSGNRNFEGRINTHVKANYLASPPLVVAYALAGTVNINMEEEPLGKDPNGRPVYLKDIWPKNRDIQKVIDQSLNPEIYVRSYSDVFTGSSEWENLNISKTETFEWNNQSTYIREPPFFMNFTSFPLSRGHVKGARVLVYLGDSVTTDHISPAGTIPVASPAGQYLISCGIEPKDFNSFGSRRGNHEVMMRGTFSNVRLKNRLIAEREGGWTIYLPANKEMRIYDAAMRYKENKTPLLILAGKEYGTGSSRDWAAKGPYLLGVKAVIAESFERIHRGNLIGMGVLPLQFKEKEKATSIGLTGKEVYNIENLGNIAARKELDVTAEDGESVKRFKAIARLDSPVEVDYFLKGGILQTVLNNLLKKY
ncbi:aconitate hydratase AcnA [[Eubacterium] cellulosolvens]